MSNMLCCYVHTYSGEDSFEAFLSLCGVNGMRCNVRKHELIIKMSLLMFDYLQKHQKQGMTQDWYLSYVQDFLLPYSCTISTCNLLTKALYTEMYRTV